MPSRIAPASSLEKEPGGIDLVRFGLDPPPESVPLTSGFPVLHNLVMDEKRVHGVVGDLEIEIGMYVAALIGIRTPGALWTRTSGTNPASRCQSVRPLHLANVCVLNHEYSTPRISCFGLTSALSRAPWRQANTARGRDGSSAC